VKYIFIGKQNIVLFPKLKVRENQRESAVSALSINSLYFILGTYLIMYKESTMLIIFVLNSLSYPHKRR
jgi:hypothetical protein